MAWEERKAALIGIYEWLAREGKKWVDKNPVHVNLERIATNRHGVMTVEDVENLRKNKARAGSFANDRVVRLKPPNGDEGAFAVLWCRWNFEHHHNRCGFYYGLWKMTDPLPGTRVNGTGKRVPVFLGYRFETPEVAANHAFHHAQPCRSFDVDGEPIREALDRSVSNPTWPIAAKDEIQLLLCVVLSLYGADRFDELRKHLQQDRRLSKLGLLSEALADVRSLVSAH